MISYGYPVAGMTCMPAPSALAGSNWICEVPTSAAPENNRLRRVDCSDDRDAAAVTRFACARGRPEVLGWRAGCRLLLEREAVLNPAGTNELASIILDDLACMESAEDHNRRDMKSCFPGCASVTKNPLISSMVERTRKEAPRSAAI